MVLFSSCLEGLYTWSSLQHCISTTRRQHSISHKKPPETDDYFKAWAKLSARFESLLQLFLHRCDQAHVTRAGQLGWLVLQAESLASEHNPDENVLSTSSHQSELFPTQHTC